MNLRDPLAAHYKHELDSVNDAADPKVHAGEREFAFKALERPKTPLFFARAMCSTLGIVAHALLFT
jgi:hypothetical protein